MWIVLAFVLTFVFAFVVQNMIWFLYGKDRLKVNYVERMRLMGAVTAASVTSFLIKLNPWWDRKVTYEVPYEELPQPCVYMLNHTSWLDAVLVQGVLVPSGTLAKEDVYDLPLAGSIARSSLMIPVHFEKVNGQWKTTNRDKIFERAQRLLDNGVSLCLFPEGGISKNPEEMRPLKPGFFKFAVRNRVPIVPVSLWAAHKLWPIKKDNRDISTPENHLNPGTCYIYVGTPIDTNEFDPEDVEPLMDLVARTIADNRDKLREQESMDFEIEEHEKE